jgi:hypothetical protein
LQANIAAGQLSIYQTDAAFLQAYRVHIDPAARKIHYFLDDEKFGAADIF